MDLQQSTALSDTWIETEEHNIFVIGIERKSARALLDLLLFISQMFFRIFMLYATCLCAFVHILFLLMFVFVCSYITRSNYCCHSVCTPHAHSPCMALLCTLAPTDWTGVLSFSRQCPDTHYCFHGNNCCRGCHLRPHESLCPI